MSKPEFVNGGTLSSRSAGRSLIRCSDKGRRSFRQLTHLDMKLLTVADAR